MKEFTTITIQKDTRKDLMIIKYRTNAENLDEVIRTIIKKLKGESGLSAKKEGHSSHSK